MVSVTARQRGIKCSRCEIWHHAACVSLSVAEYDAVSDDVECPWYCLSCVVAIHTDTSLTSIKYEDNSLASFTSVNSTMRPLTCWCFNARSVVNKKLGLFAKLTALSSDVVMVTEMYFDDTIPIIMKLCQLITV